MARLPQVAMLGAMALAKDIVYKLAMVIAKVAVAAAA